MGNKRKEPPAADTTQEQPAKKTTLKSGMHPTKEFSQVSEEELEGKFFDSALAL